MWLETSDLNVERLVARTGAWGRGLVALGAFGSVAWLGLTAGWVPLAPEAGTASAVALNLDRLTGERLDKAAVSKATTGKAVFRNSSAEPDKVVDEIGRFQLRGVFMRGEIAKAAIRDTKRKKTLLKQQGDTLESYEIVEISPAGVKLRRGNEEVSLVR